MLYRDPIFPSKDHQAVWCMIYTSLIVLDAHSIDPVIIYMNMYIFHTNKNKLTENV